MNQTFIKPAGLLDKEKENMINMSSTVPFLVTSDCKVIKKACILKNFRRCKEFATPNKNIISCDAASEKDLGMPCTNVRVLPNSLEKNGNDRVFYQNSCLTIFCNAKVSRTFDLDDICKVFSSTGNAKSGSYTFMHGVHPGFTEVCIVSTHFLHKMVEDVDEFLQRVWRPHCLLLVLDFPQNLMLLFPESK